MKDERPIEEEASTVRQMQAEEFLEDFYPISEEAKYPPFSVPTNEKESAFMTVLSREFSDFVNGAKPYDSYEAFLEAYASELVESRAWRSLGYSPEQAATEVSTKWMASQGYTGDVLKMVTESWMLSGHVKYDLISAEILYPWEIL